MNEPGTMNAQPTLVLNDSEVRGWLIGVCAPEKTATEFPGVPLNVPPKLIETRLDIQVLQKLSQYEEACTLARPMDVMAFCGEQALRAILRAVSFDCGATDRILDAAVEDLMAKLTGSARLVPGWTDALRRHPPDYLLREYGRCLPGPLGGSYSRLPYRLSTGAWLSIQVLGIHLDIEEQDRTVCVPERVRR